LLFLARREPGRPGKLPKTVVPIDYSIELRPDAESLALPGVEVIERGGIFCIIAHEMRINGLAITPSWPGGVISGSTKAQRPLRRPNLRSSSPCRSKRCLARAFRIAMEIQNFPREAFSYHG
jgi:hypothetical protein